MQPTLHINPQYQILLRKPFLSPLQHRISARLDVTPCFPLCSQVERLRPHTSEVGHSRSPSFNRSHSHHLKTITSGTFPTSQLDNQSPPLSPGSYGGEFSAPLKYGSLGRASAPDLAALMGGSSSFVQRAGSYGGRVRRAVQRSPSMHRRMKEMLLKAKQRAVAQQRRCVCSC